MTSDARAPSGEPQRYRKKPVVIEAMQFNGTEASAYAICRWANDDHPLEEDPWVDYVIEDGVAGDMLVHTLEGEMSVSRGDWVIRGVKGEHYPVKDEIFRETYEHVEDAHAS